LQDIAVFTILAPTEVPLCTLWVLTCSCVEKWY